MNTALFLLRAVELGLSLDDLDKLTIGMILDMQTEKDNDSYDWPVLASQEDMNRFSGLNFDKIKRDKKKE